MNAYPYENRSARDVDLFFRNRFEELKELMLFLTETLDSFEAHEKIEKIHARLNPFSEIQSENLRARMLKQITNLEDAARKCMIEITDTSDRRSSVSKILSELDRLFKILSPHSLDRRIYFNWEDGNVR